MTIYEELKEAGIKLDNHESDLYVEVTEMSKHIVSTYKHFKNVTAFISQIDKQLWYDIPFAYDPFWDKGLSNLTGGRLVKLH